MNNCSEYVGSGHPDKVADLVASHLLDAFVRHDPKTRFALEVQMKDHVCNLAGEVTSTWNPAGGEIADLAREAIRKVGYTAEYASRWPEGATLNADKVAAMPAVRLEKQGGKRRCFLLRHEIGATPTESLPGFRLHGRIHHDALLCGRGNTAVKHLAGYDVFGRLFNVGRALYECRTVAGSAVNDRLAALPAKVKHPVHAGIQDEADGRMAHQFQRTPLGRNGKAGNGIFRQPGGGPGFSNQICRLPHDPGRARMQRKNNGIAGFNGNQRGRSKA